MPVVVTAAVPGSSMAPPVTLPLDVTLLAGDEPGQDIPAPLRPSPAAAARAPTPAVGPSPRRCGNRSPRGGSCVETAPPVLDGPSPPRRPSAPTTRNRPEFLPDPSPPEAPAERRAIDPLILSDMARQLQVALARPTSAVTPNPAVVVPEPLPLSNPPRRPPWRASRPVVEAVVVEAAESRR